MPEFVVPKENSAKSVKSQASSEEWAQPEDSLKDLKFEILKVRKDLNSKLEYYVHFEGYDKRYDRWLDQVSVNSGTTDLTLSKDMLSPRSTRSSLAPHSFSPSKSMVGFDCSLQSEQDFGYDSETREKQPSNWIIQTRLQKFSSGQNINGNVWGYEKDGLQKVLELSRQESPAKSLPPM